METNRSLKEELLAEPWNFAFVQAINILCHEQDNLGLQSNIGFAPPTSEVSKIHFVDDKPYLEINILGLAGIIGPLPFTDSELLILRSRFDDTAMRDFFDIFNQRLGQLLYKLQHKLLFAHPKSPPAHWPLGKIFLNIMGLRQNFGNLLPFANIISSYPHSRKGLNTLLNQYFSLPFQISGFKGKLITVANANSQLGKKWSNLSFNAVLGNGQWKQNMGFTLTLGPINSVNLEEFIPGHVKYKELKEIIKVYLEANVEVEFIIKVVNPSPMHLGKTELGYCSFLGPQTHFSTINLGLIIS